MEKGREPVALRQKQVIQERKQDTSRVTASEEIK